jgi:hypothetical protein
MHGGAHAADTLGKHPGIAGIAPQYNLFNTPPHLSGRPGVDNSAVIDLTVDPQVAFDAGNGINGYSLWHNKISAPAVEYLTNAASTAGDTGGFDKYGLIYEWLDVFWFCTA